MINNSETGAADYAHWLGLAIDRFVVKRNGLDAATFRRADPNAVAELRSQLSIPPDSPVIGSIFDFLKRSGRSSGWKQVRLQSTSRAANL